MEDDAPIFDESELVGAVGTALPASFPDASTTDGMFCVAARLQLVLWVYI
jgi:hypothetical protein